MEKFEQSLADAVRRGEEIEYGIFDFAMDDLLIFRSSQINLPRRKLQRRINRIQTKHWRDQRRCKKIR
jgi:hypothetical protein